MLLQDQKINKDLSLLNSLKFHDLDTTADFILWRPTHRNIFHVIMIICNTKTLKDYL